MKRTLLAAGLLAMLIVPLEAEHFPEIPATGLEIHTHGRLFAYHGDLSGMVEYVGRFEDPDLEFRYQSLTLGGYYRVHRNVKAGAFYRLQAGAHHDDDWVVTTYPQWDWRETSGRLEHLVLLDVTPRFLLDFLPGGNWVGSVKNRYAYNFYNAHQTLLVRPGLTWFWMVDREPVLNVSAQYATYLSLNFGDRFWYRHGPYLNVLYHVTPFLQIDASLARHTIYWTESREFEARHPGETYERNTYSPWVVDVGFVVTLRTNR